MLAMGIYCVQLALFVFGGETPEKVQSSGVLNDFGADAASSTTLKFSGDRFATFTLSFDILMPNEAFIVGSKGWIKMTSPFLATTKLELSDGQAIECPLPIAEKQPILENSTGLSYQCEELRTCLLQGDP